MKVEAEEAVRITFDKDISDIRLHIALEQSTSSVGRVIIAGELPRNTFISIQSTGNSYQKEGGQKSRFDEHLLTGCLTFLDSSFEGLQVRTKNLPCEDSVHFVRSEGSISLLDILNSSHDGVDFDWSKLTIESALINNAGNDCLDMSMGTYLIGSAKTSICADKAVSVGERGIVSIDHLEIEGAKNGVVAKDLAKVVVGRLVALDVDVCVAAFQKKQQYGPASIHIKESDSRCKSSVKVERGSRVVLH